MGDSIESLVDSICQTNHDPEFRRLVANIINQAISRMKIERDGARIDFANASRNVALLQRENETLKQGNARLCGAIDMVVSTLLSVRYATADTDGDRIRIMRAIGDSSLLAAREAGEEVK